MKNNINTITKKQLIDELERYDDDAPILLNVKSRNYPINCVISGGGGVYLEADLPLGRPGYATEAERRAARLASYRKANARRRENKKAGE